MHFNGIIYSKEELWASILISVVHRGGSSTLLDDLTARRAKPSPISKLARPRITIFVEDVETNFQKKKASMVKVKLPWERAGNGRPQQTCKYFLLIDTARFELCLFPV